MHYNLNQIHLHPYLAPLLAHLVFLKKKPILQTLPYCLNHLQSGRIQEKCHYQQLHQKEVADLSINRYHIIHIFLNNNHHDVDPFYLFLADEAVTTTQLDEQDFFADKMIAPHVPNKATMISVVKSLRYPDQEKLIATMNEKIRILIQNKT